MKLREMEEVKNRDEEAASDFLSSKERSTATILG